MAEWIKCHIGDLCNTISDTYRGNDRNVVLINTSDVLEGKVLNHNPVVNKNLKGQFKKTFKKDDILYSEIRPANKRFAFIDFDDTSNYIASTKLMVLRPNNKVLPKYLFALLKSNDVIAELQHLAETRSGTFPQITFSSELAPMSVLLPDKETQKKFVNILSIIEDKIDLNLAINKNLEQQVRTLFRSWFVSLEPFQNRVPSDWSLGKLKDILQLKRKPIKAGNNTNLPYLPIDSIPMNSFALTGFKSNEEAKSSLIMFDKDDIIIGAMRVYFHRVILAPCAGITRTTCFTLAPYHKEYLSFALLYCDQDSSIDYAQSTSKGSTMPYAIWEGGLGELDVAIPTPQIAQKFNEIVLPMLRKIQDSYFENTQLKVLRDNLLPYLMSGKLDISDI